MISRSVVLAIALASTFPAGATAADAPMPKEQTVPGLGELPLFGRLFQL
jgi:hypothetical protein